MTEQQIPKLAASLVEHQNAFSQLSVEDGQWAIQNTVEAIGLFAVAVANRAKRVVSNMIVCHVRVNRNLSHQQVLDATGRRQYVNTEVLETAPKGVGEEVDLYFFDLSYDPTVDELDREMETRSLKPDVDALAAFNTANSEFADDRPNATQWRDDNNKACHAIFYRWDDERRVFVRRHARGWYRIYRFAGVRK